MGSKMWRRRPVDGDKSSELSMAAGSFNNEKKTLRVTTLVLFSGTEAECKLVMREFMSE